MRLKAPEKLLIVLKEYFINLALRSCNIVTFMTDSLEQIGSEIFPFLFHTFFPPCQNLAPTLPKMQLDSSVRDSGVLCWLFKAAHVALSSEPEAEISSGLQRSGELASFYLQTPRLFSFSNL